MKKILNIIQHDLIQMSREKMALILTFAMPVMLILIFGNLNFGDGGNGSSPTLPIAICTLDTGKDAQDFLNEIKKEKGISVTDLNEEDLYKQVKDSYVIAGFVIPADFSRKVQGGQVPEIQLVKLPSSANFSVATGALNNAFAKLNIKNNVRIYFSELLQQNGVQEKDEALSSVVRKVDEKLNGTPAISVEAKTYAQKKAVKKTDMKSTYTLSFSIVFVMWAVIFAAGEVLQEKKFNTWNRLLITPTGRTTLMVGKVMAAFVRGWVQVVFLILFSSLVMNVQWGESIWITILIISVFLACITSFGMLLANIVKTFAQLAAFSAIFITCTSMLAGCYWPLEIMPDNMQKLAKIFPQYWAVKALNSNVENQGFGAAVTPMLVLAGMCVLFVVVNMLISKVRLFGKKPAAAVALTE